MAVRLPARPGWWLDGGNRHHPVIVSATPGSPQPLVFLRATLVPRAAHSGRVVEWLARYRSYGITGAVLGEGATGVEQQVERCGVPLHG
jgi:hypothetical protein